VPEAPPRIAEDSVVTGSNGLSWRWPGKGALAGTFVAGDQTRQGIDIAGKAGDPVLAAGDGEVVYSGNGLLGYGELIIVKHNASFLSAYGHNRKRMVQEGDKVKAGQQIAEMGSSGSARDELHFEIRKNGKPVNPLDYLPAR
jgi:lipoprotein NlpD